MTSTEALATLRFAAQRPDLKGTLDEACDLLDAIAYDEAAAEELICQGTVTTHGFTLTRNGKFVAVTEAN